MRKILVYLGHPAQYHFFKNICSQLKTMNVATLFLIKSKDVLEALLQADGGQEYINILPEGRGSSKSGLLHGLIKRDVRLLKIAKAYQPSLMIGSDPAIAQIGRLVGIPALTVLEDDFSVIPYLALLTFPFTRKIIAPTACRCGPWTYKKISYAGYMKLAYLHPRYFQPGPAPADNYFLIRLSGLDAHHDARIRGLDCETLHQLIPLLARHGAVKILSEKPLAGWLQSFQLTLMPQDVHRWLYHAQLLVSDSQSMTMEAAMLGVPSIRYSGLTGRIGVLEELEHTYQLTCGIPAGEQEKLMLQVNELVLAPDLRKQHLQRRQAMLADKIDVARFFSWLLAEYPGSLRQLETEPDFQFEFK